MIRNKYCTQCGQPMVINAKFCAQCGHSFASVDISNATPVKEDETEENIEVIETDDPENLGFDVEAQAPPKTTVGHIARGVPREKLDPIQRVKPPKMSKKQFFAQFQKDAGSIRGGKKAK